MSAEQLRDVFGGREPLERTDLLPRFRGLLGDTAATKPFECVGDVGECRVALELAAARPDRAGNPVLAQLRAEQPARAPPPPTATSPRWAGTSSRLRMPPTISWSDLRDRRVGVWGLGVEGRANLRKLAALAASRRTSWSTTARPTSRSWATEAGGLEALAECDVVVKSPGIARTREDLRALEDAGVPVVGGLGLWLAEADRDRVLCITGTKGKSTTTAIAGHLATGLGQRVLLGGNFGTAPWDPEAPQDVDWWVVETSSYQATDVTVGPAVVAVTSLSQDHLDWHGGDPALLPRQALAVRPARRAAWGRRRRQPAAARARRPARPARCAGSPPPPTPAGRRASGCSASTTCATR